MTALEATVANLAKFFADNQTPYMVIGGIANLFWGDPRTTIDIDATVWVTDQNLETIIDKATATFKSRVENPLGFAKERRVLPLEDKTGMRIDIIFGALPYEEHAIKRAVTRTVGNATVKLCAVEDLIVHKIISQRNKDRSDLEGIFRRSGRSIDRAYLEPILQSLAKELDKPEIWDDYQALLKLIPQP